MIVMMTAKAVSIKACMRPLVILPTPSVGLRVKREQPVTGRFPRRLSPWLRRRVFAKDLRVYLTRRFFGFMYELPECWLYYRSRFQNKFPVRLFRHDQFGRASQSGRTLPAAPDATWFAGCEWA